MPWAVALAADPPTGPATEQRFPPLVVPAGFKATLFACDPLIEYPSAIAVGPKEKPGSAFVAIDYMTGLGTEIVRRDEIRLIEDANGDGYADRATVYAGGFNSIMGLSFHAGTVYAMHSPFLTALRDTDGDGRADERRDLLKGLGLPPEENPVRLHCANGIIMGHDGWLYLALGDHGCDVPRPEGDRLVHQGGAILRCRPDGRELHVFASGLRNIYDVALDDELNVFVRDNENDGGDYKLRLCHSFFGADHGYPYLYYERPGEALPPLADLGLGSSAGGACYLERQFPAEYRGSLLFCEWGRAVVRSHPVRHASGMGFMPLTESQFAAGADNDPYGFKPTDVVALRDGSLLVADWCDGQRPKRGRGRIYRISHVAGTLRVPSPGNELISQLDSESYHERVDAQDAIAARGADGVRSILQALAEPGRLGPHARMHAVWILARSREAAAQKKLWELAASDADPRVQAQAIRAIADDPDFDDNAAARLTALVQRDHLRLFEVVVALGRRRWSGTTPWLAETLGTRGKELSPPLAHAVQQALRRSEDWPQVLKLLDIPDSSLRAAAVNALACQWSPQVADGLIERLNDPRPARRAEYADLLTRVHRRPGPWTYWGYRPPPRPPNSVAWERTTQIEQALNGVLQGADPAVRLAVLRQMRRERVPAALQTLTAWLAQEYAAERAAAILDALREQPADQTRAAFTKVVADRQHAEANRALALELLAREPNDAAADLLVPLLNDSSALVRSAAAAAAGKLQLRAASAPVVRLAADPDPQVRRSSLVALRQLKEPQAAPLAVKALADRTTQLAALEYLAELGGPEQAAAVLAAARQDPIDPVALLSIAALTRWSLQRSELGSAVLELQGHSGLLVRWQVAGPLPPAEADELREQLAKPAEHKSAEWRTLLAEGLEARVALKSQSPGVWLAYADFAADAPAEGQFLASASGKFQVWLNGQSVYRRDEQRNYQPESDRFDAALAQGPNRVVVELSSATDAAQFHVRFRRKSSAAEVEKLVQAALNRKGDPGRGRTVFFDAKSQCSKCHKVGDQGERIGPELTGIGGRFSKIHIVESILEPSRTVTPGFQTLSVRLVDGRVLSGIRIAETDAELKIADQQGQKHVLAKAEIDAQQPQAKSTMPDNLAQQLTAQQFIDLVAFLAGQK